jgi:hypothetical protein
MLCFPFLGMIDQLINQPYTDINMTIEASTLLYALERNYDTLIKQIDGITDEESLLQLPFRGNCLNWILGHLLQSRNRWLIMLGEAPIWTPEQVARYVRNSPPVTDASDALPFTQMITDLHLSQQRLLVRLQSISQAELDSETTLIPSMPARPTSVWLQISLWHETYHIGSTEILRQLAGKDDQVM